MLECETLLREYSTASGHKQTWEKRQQQDVQKEKEKTKRVESSHVGDAQMKDPNGQFVNGN